MKGGFKSELESGLKGECVKRGSVGSVTRGCVRRGCVMRKCAMR